MTGRLCFANGSGVESRHAGASNSADYLVASPPGQADPRNNVNSRSSARPAIRKAHNHQASPIRAEG
jgi:hypothetical protein